jgi:hypothetical protein
MTIIIEIKPGVQADLCRRAAAHGVDIEAYAGSLLGEATHLSGGPKTLSQTQLENTLRELGQFSHKIPLPPDEASRGKVCIRIPTDGQRRRLSPRQQHPIAYQ